jgi:hypothetical protein
VRVNAATDLSGLEAAEPDVATDRGASPQTITVAQVSKPPTIPGVVDLPPDRLGPEQLFPGIPVIEIPDVAFPVVPAEKPADPGQPSRIARDVVDWVTAAGSEVLPLVIKAITSGKVTPAGIARDVAIEGGFWLFDRYGPSMASYFDPPKPIGKLQEAAARGTRKGYNIHHIVEQTPAEAAGFPRLQIDAPENVILIPEFKHWLITAWFMLRQDETEGQKPREYLRDKSWDERYKIGIEALKRFGVIVQ